jgi:hypothetical protein
MIVHFDSILSYPSTPSSTEEEEDYFILISDLVSSTESLYAFIEDNEEQERREIAKAAIQEGVEKINLTAVRKNEDIKSKVNKEIRETKIKREGSVETKAPKGHAKAEYLHEESSLETNTSMSNINDKASMQA